MSRAIDTLTDVEVSHYIAMRELSDDINAELQRRRQVVKLSEQLKLDHDSGNFGQMLKGYSERAAKLERLVEAVAYIGVDFGHGPFELNEGHIKEARELPFDNTTTGESDAR